MNKNALAIVQVMLKAVKVLKVLVTQACLDIL